MIRIIILILLLAGNAYAARNVTVPFSEDFDADFTDLDWLSNGATESFMSTGGWSGGAKRIYPPTSAPGGNGDYGAMGAFDFTTAVEQVNIRILVRFGVNYISTSTAGVGNMQNKIMIIDGTATRGILSLAHWDSPATDFSFGPCNNSTCKYENGDGTAAANGDFFPTDSNTFQLSEHLGDWVCLEWEVNATTGANKLYIWTADGAISGLYKEYEITTGGTYDNIQVIGGFFNGYHTSDADAYIEWDELSVSTSYIGPPTGFLESTPLGTRRSAIIIAGR